MDLGERISPASVSELRNVLFNVESLRDARTPLAGFFSILLERDQFEIKSSFDKPSAGEDGDAK